MKRLTWLMAGAMVLGLAVPAMAGGDHAGACEQSAEACLAYFAQKAENYGWVGIELDKTDYDMMQVTRVVEESPASAKKGFQKGDILIALNGVELNDENKDALKEAKGDWAPGQQVTYTVKRHGEKTEVMITLGELPQSVLAQWVGNHMLESHMEVAAAE